MKHIARIFMFAIAIMTFAITNAQDKKAVVRIRTSASIGSTLRIYATPFNSQTISGGAKNAAFFGEYEVTDPSKDIIIEGELDNLEIYGCSLTDIFIDKAPELQILSCYDNNLTSLDLTNCPSLVNLNCKNNKLTSLDVSTNKNIEKIVCSNNEITSLELGSAAKLSTLECGYNKLQNINTSNCPELVDLYAEHNHISNINLSNNNKLWWIKLHGNLIDSEMESFVSNLPQATQSMSMLYIIDTRFCDEKNRMSAKQVAEVLEKGWLACNYLSGIETSESMIGTFYKGYDYKPNYGNNMLQFVTGKAIGEKIKINITSMKDVIIDGVEEPAPYVGEQEYTIKSNTISIRGDIDKFKCTGSKLTSLVFEGKNIPIKEITCSDNEIKKLNLQDMKQLEKLECQQNKLEQLTVIGCDALYRIDCYRNNLKGAYMSMFVQSLYDDNKSTERKSPVVFILDSKAPIETPDYNQCYKEDVNVAKAKGWIVKDYINGEMWGFGQNIDGDDKVLPSEYAVLQSSTDYISIKVQMKHEGDTPIVEGADIVSWNGSILMIKMHESGKVNVYGDFTELFVPLCGLENIDVSNLPSLESLFCGFNNLKSLDLSKNHNLKVLSCEGNNIKSLNLADTQLYTLICYANYIEGDNMTSLINSLPKCTSESNGIFIVVDATFKDENGKNREHNICTMSDIEDAKAKMWSVYDLNGAAENLRNYNGYDSEYISPGLGGIYSLKDLSEMFGSGIEKEGENQFNITKSITISNNDKFILEDNVNATVETGVIMSFEGDVEMAPKTKGSFKVHGIEENEWGGFHFKGSPNDVVLKNIDFTGLVVKYSAMKNFLMDNCSLKFVPECKLSKSGAVSISFAEHATITNCEFIENEHSGIATGANSNVGVLIENCVFTGNSTLNRNHPQINLGASSDKLIAIRNNTVTGNPSLTKVGGISVSNMLGDNGENNIEISGNTVTDNRYGITILGKSNSIIKDNILRNNDKDPNAMTGGSGISLYDTKETGLTSHIEGNTIEGNLWGITVIGCTDVNIGKTCVDEGAEDYNRGGNIFKNNGNNGILYDLYNNSSNTIYAQGNTWNVDEQTKENIEKVIFHKNDDDKLGEVIYWDETFVGIDSVISDKDIDNIKCIYDAAGMKKDNISKGVNIIIYNDGSMKKIYVK